MSCWMKKSMKNRSKNQSKLKCKLGWILDVSWIDFGWIWGPSWEASWGQVGTKIQKMRVPRRGQKMSGKKVMRVIRSKTEERGSGPLKQLKTPLQGPNKAIITLHFGLKARWRIYISLYIM